jgi:AcrR family transcriptional regulator
MPMSRKLSKERTRARLLQGTLRVLHSEGAGALTTGRIAESAGVAQPTFYVHFSGIDEALQLAATTVSDRWLVGVHAARQEVDRSSGVRPSVHGIIASYVDTLMEDAKGAELFLRHRRDATSPLGRTFAKLSEKVRRDLVEDLATAGHITEEQLGPKADLCLGIVLGAVESVLDGHATRAEAIESASKMLYLLIVETIAPAETA